jgi:hypothetical protein
MNVTFHALAAAGIGHVAAIRLRSSQKNWFKGPDVWVLGSVMCLGILSHGVLDGLKHGYPIRSAPDVVCASLLALCWCICACRRYRLLFASVFLASFAPDILDFGPRILHSMTGLWMPMIDGTPLFPWHWPDGSGSMYSSLNHAPARTRILDIGDNRIISWTNHLIVVAFAASGVLANPRVFRFMPPP